MENYFWNTEYVQKDKKIYMLVIYDIVSNKRRVKFAKKMNGYGFRVQKSAFEAMLSKTKYDKLVREIPKYINTKSGEDSVRIYRITGKGKVKVWGDSPQFEEEIILI